MSKHDDDTCPHLVRASLLEAENARLQAEIERLKADNKSQTNACRINTFMLKDQIDDLYAENANLKAEVERLRKAGDAVCSALILFEMKSEEEREERIKTWSAAKEGKPNV